MKLFAKSIYNNYDTAIYQEECNQAGFNALYERGLEILSFNPDVNYEIGVFTDDMKLFWSINPYPLKVAKNYLNENFEEYAQEELNAFLSEDFQNDPHEMEFMRKKQEEWESVPDFINRTRDNIEIWGRLGISLTVNSAELEVLCRDKNKAKELLIDLIQSDKCHICGDTYFPELVYNNYMDLDFDLPEIPLHKLMPQQSLDSLINDANFRINGRASINKTPDLMK